VDRTKAVFRHTGLHDHASPIINKPEAFALDKLKKVIKANPSRTPLQLSVGTSNDPQNESSSVRNIDPAYFNRARVAYLRRSYLQDEGIIECKEHSFLMVQFQELYGPELIVSNSMRVDERHISVQTDMMKKWHVDEALRGEITMGGQTDATYSYFNEGYLFSSSVYCPMLKRWVPVLFTWTEGNSELHYIPHFIVLFGQIEKLTDLSDAMKDLLVAQVMDFSDAQRKAFASAYSIVFASRFNSKKEALDHAQTLLKGCREHFRASVQRVKRIGSVVHAYEKDDFEELCMELLDEDLTLERFVV